MKKYALSPSTLNIFIDCPRCFWLHINRNIKRPRGIFPSLPGGMDLIIKSYFDKYRLKNELPPEIVGKVKGKLFPDIKIIEKWRSWKDTNLIYVDSSLNASLSGALDDCIVEDNRYVPLDYKTKGSAPQAGYSDFYKAQLDCYCLILESTGYRTKNLAYLVYYWPEEAKEQGIIKFSVETIPMKTDIEAAKNTLKEAVSTLSRGIPKSNLDCEYCKLSEERKNEF